MQSYANESSDTDNPDTLASAQKTCNPSDTLKMTDETDHTIQCNSMMAWKSHTMEGVTSQLKQLRDSIDKEHQYVNGQLTRLMMSTLPYKQDDVHIIKKVHVAVNSQGLGSIKTEHQQAPAGSLTAQHSGALNTPHSSPKHSLSGPPIFQPASTGRLSDHINTLQDHVSLTAEHNLDLLDQCVVAVEKLQQEIQPELVAMTQQYGELVEQMAVSSAYWNKLRHENEAIKDSYEEAIEENSVILERFNDELETIFNVVKIHTASLEKRSGGKAITEPPEGSPQKVQALLLKAIKDRSVAEEQERIATLQARYFRHLLEKHGVPVDDKELLLPHS